MDTITFRAVSVDGEILGSYSIEIENGAIIQRSCKVVNAKPADHLDRRTEFKDSKGYSLYERDVLLAPVTNEKFLFYYLESVHAYVVAPIKSLKDYILSCYMDLTKFTYSGNLYSNYHDTLPSAPEPLITIPKHKEPVKEEKSKELKGNKGQIYNHYEIFRNGSLRYGSLLALNVGDSVSGSDLPLEYLPRFRKAISSFHYNNKNVKFEFLIIEKNAEKNVFSYILERVNKW